MPTLPCPRCGAQSTEPDFCSECGASMQPAAATPAPSAATPTPTPTDADGADESCPSCGEARPGKTTRYCENCRYDFLTRQPFSVSAVPAPAQPAPSAPAPQAASEPTAPLPSTASPAPAPSGAQHWDLCATTDLSWRRDEDPMPTDPRDRIFPLDLSEHLIGRRSDKEDVHPEIVLTDPGVSRRHARIARAVDGTLTLIDFGSLNGTRLNGVEIEANVPMTLVDDDVITLGIWTRLVVKAR